MFLKVYFSFFREAELKHGRVAMLASLGIFVGEKYHSLFGSDFDGLSYAAITHTPLKKFWFVIVIVLSTVEVLCARKYSDLEATGMRTEGHIPGDYGFDPLRLREGFEDKGTFKELQAKELNNGRLAMIAAAGMIAQELATGEKIF